MGTAWNKVKVIPRISQAMLATQIASLVNNHNQLRYTLSAGRVLNGPIIYMVELDGETIMGCVGLKKLRMRTFWELCHLCVHPKYRGLRLAPKLVEAAYKRIPTGNAWATIREDNIPSIRTFLRCGFNVSSKFKSSNKKYFLVVMTRERNSGKPNEKTLHNGLG